jgi:SAM-dependent methyltransferase
VNYYQVRFDEELRHLERAMQYYSDWGKEIESRNYQSEYLRKYYAGYSSTTASVRFRALFFAMRIQPVLSYIEEFCRAQQRAPRLLDLGCGYGMETLLLGMAGAQVHGVDVSDEKIGMAGAIKRNIERKHGVSLDVSFEFANLFQFRAVSPFDGVYSSATLHHIEPVADAFQSIANLIVPDGHFFLSDENGFSPVQQLMVQKRIGFTKPRKLLMTNRETGEQYWYGNENIRAPFLWARYMRNAGFHPLSIKYCRFLPPLDWTLTRLIKVERGLRSLPIVAQLGAIGFLLTAQKTG